MLPLGEELHAETVFEAPHVAPVDSLAREPAVRWSPSSALWKLQSAIATTCEWVYKMSWLLVINAGHLALK